MDFADLFEREPCGHVVTSLDGDVVRANAMFHEMTGYRPDELVGRRRFQELLTAAGRIYHETHLRPLLHLQGYLREIALELRCADGSQLPILVNSAIRRDDHGSPIGVQTVVFDATERRSYERELLVATRRIERMQRVAAVFASALSPEEIAREALTEIVDGAKADHGLLALHDAARGGLTVVDVLPRSAAVTGAWQGLRMPDVEPVERALSSGEAVFVEAEDAPGQSLPPLAEHGSPCSRVALLPLVVDERALGILCLGSTTQNAFEPNERSFLVSFARLSAQALERSRLHRADELAAARTRFLASLGRALDESVELGERAQCLVDALVPEHADFAAVEIPDLGARPVAARHRDAALLGALLDFRERANLAGGHSHPFARERSLGEPQLLHGLSDERYTGYAHDEQELALLRILAPRAHLGLPLRARGEIVGSLVLAMSSSDRRFSPEELPFLRDIADRAALALDNARLLEHRQQVARRLQLSMLPEVLPADERVRLSARYLPGATLMEIGGDWYDAFLLPGDLLGFAVGDVVGHDIDAAIAMGQVRTALRAFALEGGGPRSTLDRLSQFALSVSGALCTTVAYAELELDGGRVRYACAGHLPPAVVDRETGARYLWEGRSPPLGIPASSAPAEGTVVLGGGASLVLVTDGLVERRRRSLDDGLEQVLATLRAGPSTDPEAVVDRLVASLLSGVEQADDVCVLAVSLAEPPRSRAG